MVEPGQPAFERLVERFGHEIVGADGRLDRPKLAEIAFATEEATADLNAITHPAVGEEFLRRMTDVPGDAIVVCDVPLLVESETARSRGYEFVIVVEAPRELRLERLEGRGVPVPTPKPAWRSRPPTRNGGRSPPTSSTTRPIATTSKRQVHEIWTALSTIDAERRAAAALGVTGVGTIVVVPPLQMVSEFSPAGDQPEAIASARRRIENGDRFQTLLGITGSGKSFTIANVIEQVQRPTIVLAPNKSLAAQLASEFRELFPKNRVEYFVSYYDYYQPEAYLPTTDTYIEKDSSINDEIDRLRHSATSAIMSRRDVIVVASVSAIYGLGAPDEYERQCLIVNRGEEREQRSILSRLVDLQYERNDFAFSRQQVPCPGRHDRDLSVVRRAGGSPPALRRRSGANRRGRSAYW